MIYDVVDEDLNDDLIERACKVENVKLSKALNSPKYVVLDWRYYPIDKLKDILPSLDKDIIRDYCLDGKMVNNVEVLFEMFKYVEEEDEGNLWSDLVDNNRFISHEFYISQSYRQNFDIWVKMLHKPMLNTEVVSC